MLSSVYEHAYIIRMLNELIPQKGVIVLTKDSYTDRRIRKSKQALQTALLILLKTQRLHEITISNLVQIADLNRGTFYANYDRKEQILDDIITEVITDLISSYRSPIENETTFDFKHLTASSIKIFNHVEAHASFYQLILAEESFLLFQKRITSELKRLSLVEIHQQLDDQTIDLDLLASYQAHAIFGLIVTWVESDFKYSAYYMSQQLLKIVSSNLLH